MVSSTSSEDFLAVAAKASHSCVLDEIYPVRSSSCLFRPDVTIWLFLSNSERLVAESTLKASSRSSALSISNPSSSFYPAVETRSIAKAAISSNFLIPISLKLFVLIIKLFYNIVAYQNKLNYPSKIVFTFTFYFDFTQSIKLFLLGFTFSLSPCSLLNKKEIGINLRSLLKNGYFIFRSLWKTKSIHLKLISELPKANHVTQH